MNGGRDANEALTALERLYQKKVVTLEEAQAAAKLITGDPKTDFPPAAPRPAAPVAEAPMAPPSAPADAAPRAPADQEGTIGPEEGAGER